MAVGDQEKWANETGVNLPKTLFYLFLLTLFSANV